MTTPTPPPGYRLLTPEEYEKPLPEGTMFLGYNSTEWRSSTMIGQIAYAAQFYAIPITHPATGDAKPDPLGHKIDGKEALARTLADLDAQIARAYKLPFSVKGDNPPAIVDATGEAVLSMMWPVHEQTPQGEQLAVSYTKNWAQTICDLVNESNTKPVEQREELSPEAMKWVSGDTTNEKGGEPCAALSSQPQQTIPESASVIQAHRQTTMEPVVSVAASNAALDVRPVEQRQELLPCPFCGAEVGSIHEDGDDFLDHPKNECCLADTILFLTNWNTRK